MAAERGQTLLLHPLPPVMSQAPFSGLCSSFVGDSPPNWPAAPAEVASNCPLFRAGSPHHKLGKGERPSLSFICAAETPQRCTKTICSPIFSWTLCRETQYFGGAAEILLVLI